MPIFKHKSTRERFSGLAKTYTITKIDFINKNYKTLYLCILNTFTICGLMYAGFVQKVLPENGCLF